MTLSAPAMLLTALVTVLAVLISVSFAINVAPSGRSVTWAFNANKMPIRFETHRAYKIDRLKNTQRCTSL